MRIVSVKADGFRNLKEIDFIPKSGINVFLGENAQGKTNLTEALWIASGQKSFRGAREKDLIAFDRDTASIDIVFENSEREQNISVTLSRHIKERRIILNGLNLRSFSELLGRLQCVIFTPEDLDLTKGSPDVRRSYIDLCISQIKPMYSKVILKYENILAQRNAVLKNIAFGISKTDELDVWDEQLSRQGAYISMMRSIYTEILNSRAAELYSEISRKKESLELEYISTVYENLKGRTDYKNSMAKEYLNKLIDFRTDDIRSGYTGAGIHRDEITVKIDGVSVKDFGSQGQNRSAALCMKLGQAKALLKETGEMPVILLDDVLSELDKYRKEFVLNQINDAQIFITCCEPVIKSGGVFKISGGRIEKRN